MDNYRLLETIADISYIADESKYFAGDSKCDINTFIYWANEFEKIH